MVYLYDLLFVCFFIGMKDLAMWLLDKEPEVYKRVRNYYIWFEYSFVCLAFYFIPDHTLNEALVAFFMSLCTKGIHDFVKKKTNTLTSYEKTFIKNNQLKLKNKL